MLFNEPKLLKLLVSNANARTAGRGFSALQRAEIAEIRAGGRKPGRPGAVSVLFNEPKLLKFAVYARWTDGLNDVSVLFNEPKLLKF